MSFGITTPHSEDEEPSPIASRPPDNRRKKIAARVANAFMFVLFLYSCVVQFNDPDAFWWALLYAFAAVFCFGVEALTHKYRDMFWRPLAIGYVASCLIVLVYFLIRGILNDLTSEEQLELAGTSIAIIWVVTILYLEEKFILGRGRYRSV